MTAARAPRHAIIASGDLGNVGDLLLLLQGAAGMRAHCGIDRVTVRQGGLPDAAVAQVLAAQGIGHLSWRNPATVWQARGALVAVCGGQMLRDNTSIRALLHLAAMMAVARITGGRAAIVACGATALSSRPRRWVWRAMARLSCLVTARDAASARVLQGLLPAGHAPVPAHADIAFAPGATDALIPARGPAGHITLAPCRDGSEGRHLPVEATARLAANLARAAGLPRVVLVAHDLRPMADSAIIAHIRENMAAIAPDIATEVLATADLATILRCYAGSLITLTNRLHAAIFSLLAGADVMILDDGTPKTRALADAADLALTAAGQPVDAAETLARAAQRRLAGGNPALPALRQSAEAHFTDLAAALQRR